MSTAIKGMQRKPGGETYLFKASYISTPNAGGYYTDQYGNFQHASTTATNRWTIKSNDGVDKFQIYFETGNTEVGGTLSVGGNADVKGNQVVIGDTNRTYAQVKFSTANYTDAYIRAYDKNEYGQAWVFKNGGSMIIGGGESPSGLYSNNIDGCADANNEQLFLSSDSFVHIYSNANTIADRKHWYFNNAGQIYLPDGTARISQDGNLYFKYSGDNYGWLSTLINGKEPTIADSGWQTPVFESGVSAGTGVVIIPRYRKYGKFLILEGTVGFTVTTSAQILFTLPSGYRPLQAHYVSAQCSGARIARVRVNPGGAVACEWIYGFDGTRFTGDMTWIDISMIVMLS